MFKIILLILIVLLILWGISIYNQLQRTKVQIDETNSQIDVQLKRRNDLIPNLVSTVKGYAKHESETFEKVTQLRNQMQTLDLSNVSNEEKMALSEKLSGALRSVFAIAENYPELKANENFMQLQEELTNTENKIAYSRQLFNTTAAHFNQMLHTFPSNLIAKMSHLQDVKYLEISEKEKEAPKVEF